MTKHADPPTLAQIKAGVEPMQGWFWSAHNRGVPALEAKVCEMIDAAFEAGRCHEAGLPVLMTIDAHDVATTAKAAFAEQQKRIAALEAWKSSALSVMAPLQDIAKEFSLPLGLSIPAEMAKLLRKQATEIDRLHGTLANDTDYASLATEVAYLRQDRDYHVRQLEALEDAIPFIVSAAWSAFCARFPAHQPRHIATTNLAARWDRPAGYVKE